MDYSLDFFQSMPKTELHLHLDGALQTETAVDLWKALPEQYKKTLPEFPSTLECLADMLGNRRIRKNQEELLQAFVWPGHLLQTREALIRIAYELVLFEHKQNIRYCEIRFAPSLHRRLGLSLEEVFEAVLEGCRKGQKETGLTFSLIACGMRHLPLEENLEMLEHLAVYHSAGLRAVDFAGFEARDPNPLEQKLFFERARARGYACTLHGGEIQESLDFLREAVYTIHPERIAHGSTLIQDPEMCAFLAQEKIALDLCPTSNLQSALYPSYREFPVRELLDRGVPLTISTDDPVVSRMTLAEEYQNLYETGRYTLEELWQVNCNGLYFAFGDTALCEPLKVEFQKWYEGWKKCNE